MKRKIALLFGCIAFILSACSVINKQETQPSLPLADEPAATQNQTLSMQDYFPLRQGAYWIYEGQIRWTNPTEAEIVEETIRWKMEVVRVIQRGNVVGFEMLGAPTDLAWYEEGKLRTSYAYILTGGKIYQMPIDTLDRMTDESDTLYDLVDETSEFLSIPLMDGQKICPAELMTRTDWGYCWHVSALQGAEPITVNGVEMSSPKEYILSIMTGPDRSDIAFIPGIGISRYHYVHNGTVAEADVKLVDYFPGNE